MWRDDAYLLDILIATRQVIEFMRGINKEEFEQDKRLQYALEKLLQDIGEAARSIS